MSIVITLLYVIEVVVCLMLALVVMLQKPKEGGLGGLAGSLGESVLGADANVVLIKTTAILGAIFLANTLVLARLTSTVHSRSIMAGEAEPAAQAAPDAAPIAPALPSAPELPAELRPNRQNKGAGR